LDIIRVAPLADVAVIDDRYLNQYPAITHEGVTKAILTTGDLLAGLQLNANEYAEHMTHCRSFGLAFLHISSAELEGLLARAPIAEGRVVETAELRVLREYLLVCRMSTGLQLPKETVWFDGVIRVLTAAIKAQWRGVDVQAARARSDWLWRQADLRGWSHRFVNEHTRGISQVAFRKQLLTLMMFSLEASSPNRIAFWEWLEATILDDVRSHHGDIYGALMDDVERAIDGVVARQSRGDVDAE
jgi:hypothetical protein